MRTIKGKKSKLANITGKSCCWCRGRKKSKENVKKKGIARGRKSGEGGSGLSAGWNGILECVSNKQSEEKWGRLVGGRIGQGGENRWSGD